MISETKTMPQSTLNQPINDGLFALFKGESGTGKSVAALSFPTPYVFDFDRKMPGIARKHFPEKNIQYDTFSLFQEVMDRVAELRQDCPYETVISDSYTFLCSLLMNSIAHSKSDSVPQMLQRMNEPTKRGVKSTGVKTFEPMSMDYYTGEVRLSEWYIDQLKSLWIQPGNPKYVIITAHVLKVDPGPNIFKPDAPVTVTRDIVSKGKKAGQQLPAGFDDVYLFGYESPNAFKGEEKVRHICFTEAYGEDSAKCSLVGMPERLDFTDGSLYDMMFNRVILGR